MWSKYLSLSWGPGSLKLITKRKISHYRGTQLQWENQIWVGGNKFENGSISSGETFVFFFVEWCLHHWFLHHSIKNLMEVLLRFSEDGARASQGWITRCKGEGGLHKASGELFRVGEGRCSHQRWFVFIKLLKRCRIHMPLSRYIQQNSISNVNPFCIGIFEM